MSIGIRLAETLVPLADYARARGLAHLDLYVLEAARQAMSEVPGAAEIPALRLLADREAATFAPSAQGAGG
jgi:hypothetical protein